MLDFNKGEVSIEGGEKEIAKKNFIKSYLDKKKDFNFFEDKELKKTFFDENRNFFMVLGGFYRNYRFYLYKCLNIYFTEKYLISKKYLENFSEKGLDQKKIYDFLMINFNYLDFEIDSNKIDDLLKNHIYSFSEFNKLILRARYLNFEK